MSHTTATQHPCGFNRKCKCNTPPLRTDILTEEQLGSLIEIAKAHPHLQDLRDIVVIISNTGIRQLELATLSWPDVDLEKRQLTVLAGHSGRRIVPFGLKTHSVLEARRKRLPESTFVLGKAPRVILARVSLQLRSLGAQIGVSRLNLTSLRRTFTMRLLTAGASFTTLFAIWGLQSNRTRLKTSCSVKAQLSTIAREQELVEK